MTGCFHFSILYMDDMEEVAAASSLAKEYIWVVYQLQFSKLTTPVIPIQQQKIHCNSNQ